MIEGVIMVNRMAIPNGRSGTTSYTGKSLRRPLASSYSEVAVLGGLMSVKGTLAAEEESLPTNLMKVSEEVLGGTFVGKEETKDVTRAVDGKDMTEGWRL
jgi:hypothetical protein